MNLHCPHCHASHKLKEPGEQMCAACGQTFTVDEVPVYEVSDTKVGPQIMPDGTEVTVQDHLEHGSRFWRTITGRFLLGAILSGLTSLLASFAVMAVAQIVRYNAPPEMFGWGGLFLIVACGSAIGNAGVMPVIGILVQG